MRAIEFAYQGKPKQFIFISSTSAIDTEYYVHLSDSLSLAGEGGVPEDDPLEGSRTGLKTGYGQSKWVSEKLLFEAGKRGLNGYIIRPGYIVGDTVTAGAWNVQLEVDPSTNSDRNSHQYRRLYMALGERLHPTWTRPRHKQYHQHGSG